MTPFHLYLYGRDRGPLDTSFEQAAARLERLPLLHFEPDGSFVWCQSGAAQQVFGMLYDANDRLQYVELRGTCSRSMWRDLIAAIAGGTEDDLAIMRLPLRQWQNLQRFEQSSF